MEWYGAAGAACIVLAALLFAGVVAVFRADARRESGHGMSLAVMVTLGVVAPLLFLSGVVLLGIANSDSWGR